MRMKAAETNASSAMADCTPLAVVSRSVMTADIDTFISEVSTTRTNIAIASKIIRRRFVEPGDSLTVAGSVLMTIPCSDGARTSGRTPGPFGAARAGEDTGARPLPGSSSAHASSDDPLSADGCLVWAECRLCWGQRFG